MVETNEELTYKLLDLMQKTGYNIVQHNGQRRYGPPPEWTGSVPGKGCEVFVGKLPRDIFEDELVPIFSKVGKIYEMRLMMDFSGSNRGYAFVTYMTRSEAAAAVKQLNEYEIRKGRHIGVVRSVDNCRLFVGAIPKTKTKEQVLEELSKYVHDIVDVVLYTNCFDRRLNRGFAFVEFASHRAAAMARRSLVPGVVKLWDHHNVLVDWAEPEPNIDDEEMQKVKVLYVRNFQIRTTPDVIQAVFENAIDKKIERIKKIYDYAFIHFYERAHAERAMKKLQNVEIDDVKIEIKWAKPVDRELYRIQKMNKGNAKFNTAMDVSQSMLLYKQYLEKREYDGSPRDDEGISSGYAGESSCGSPGADIKRVECWAKSDYTMAPAKLDSMCKRYMWAPPMYEYVQYADPARVGSGLWSCQVELPHVGLPLLTSPRRIGPLATRPVGTRQQALCEAAEYALNCIKILRADLIQRSAVYPATQLQPPTQMYSTVLPPLQSCIGLSCDYFSVNAPMYPRPPPPIPLPPVPMWRTA